MPNTTKEISNKIIIYENNDFYFFWKPHHIPSTFGEQKSYLDYFLLPSELESIYDPKTLSIYKSIKPFIDFSSLKKVENPEQAIEHQISEFSKEEEFGLLNRLDNDTAWFLYFAKTPTIFDAYRQQQTQNKIEKHYIAKVHGKISLIEAFRQNASIKINFPIMHHKSKDERMIVIKTPQDTRKWRGREHDVESLVQFLKYDKETNISTLLVKIHKGIRHQIRVHLASIGFPIVGDTLYGDPSEKGLLNLRSIWFKEINT